MAEESSGDLATVPTVFLDPAAGSSGVVFIFFLSFFFFEDEDIDGRLCV